MKVLLISHTCQSRTEGQPRAHELARLPEIELTLLVPDRWKRYGSWRRAQTPHDSPENSDFRFVVGRVALPWSGPGQSYLHFYPGLARLLREVRPDVIDLWEEPWSAVSAHACWLRDRICPQARIVGETEQNIEKTLPPPFERFRSFVLQRADFVVGRNAQSLEIVRRKGFAGPMRVVPNAVDTALFRPLERQRCRQELGFSGFVVGYVGRLVEEKGLFDLVAALEHLPDDVRLVFVGTGPLEADLRARVEAKNWRERVQFRGALPLEELPAVMNALDVLALPSRTTASWKEQFGRVLIEAAACRTPVIGSDSGAIPEVIGAGPRALGLVFPEGDVPALAHSIERLRAHPQLAKQLGESGFERARAEFSWACIARDMAQIYREVVA